MALLLRLLLLGLMLAAAQAQAAEKRVALVVGNGGYRSVTRLANPANDAKLMAQTLRDAGFSLIGDGPQLDLDKPRFDRALQAFGRALAGADVALFYYSGHGLQVAGENWLVPVDANPTSQQDLDFQMVSAGLVLKQMEGAGTRLNILILDACRNNPFGGRGLRATGGGLAEMHAPEGTLISYATQPGNVASDGTGADSPFTAALASVMRQPGLDVFQVFNQVGLAVKQETGGAQLPWLASSPIAGRFAFIAGTAATAAADPDTVFWQSIAGSRDPADFSAYLQRFPNGIYAGLARRRLAAPGDAAPAEKLATASGRFDGIWLATIACERHGAAAGFRVELAGQVAGGVLHLEHGSKGEPSSMQLDGSIQPDGTALLAATGVTGATQYSGVPPGSPVRYHIAAKFEDSSGAGRRLETRPCTATFQKQ